MSVLSRIGPFCLAAAILIGLSATGASAQDLSPLGSQTGDSASLWQPTLRMVLSLSAVLAALGLCTWLAKRLRNGATFKSGMIEVISAISLGGREKVVLLRVAGDEVLVGVSPSGMRPLHVLSGHSEPAKFEEFMDTKIMERKK